MKSIKSLKLILATLVLFLAVNAHAKVTVKLNFIDPPATGLHLYPEAKKIMYEAIDEVLSHLDDSYKTELKYDVCDMQRVKIPEVESFALFYNEGSLPYCGTNAYNNLVRRVSATDYEIIMIDLRQLWDFRFKDAQYKNVVANFKATIMHEFLHALGINLCGVGQSSPVIESKIRRHQDGALYFEGENVKKLVKVNSDPGVPIDTDYLHIAPIFPYDNCLIARYQGGYGQTRACPYELAMLKDIGYKIREFSETTSIIPVVLTSLDLSECSFEIEVSLTNSPAAKMKKTRQGGEGLILGTYSPNAYIDFSIGDILLVSVPIKDAGCNVFDICRKDQSFQIITNKHYDLDKNVFYVDAVIKEKALQNCMTNFLEQPLGVEACLNQSNSDFLVLGCQNMATKNFTVKINKAVPTLENPHPYALPEELKQNCRQLGHANYDSEVAIMKGKKVLAVLPFERLVENTYKISIDPEDGGGTLNVLIKTRYDFKAKWVILEYIKGKDEL